MNGADQEKFAAKTASAACTVAIHTMSKQNAGYCGADQPKGSRCQQVYTSSVHQSTVASATD
jgi:hypothetical protein